MCILTINVVLFNVAKGFPQCDSFSPFLPKYALHEHGHNQTGQKYKSQQFVGHFIQLHGTRSDKICQHRESVNPVNDHLKFAKSQLPP